jgi:hypothetical protein
MAHILMFPDFGNLQRQKKTCILDPLLYDY